MNEILAALEGRKTYIVLILLAIVSALGAEGVLDGATVEKFEGWLLLAGGGTFAAKIQRLVAAASQNNGPN